MKKMAHDGHGKEVDPQAGHKMSEAHASHDRHAGHSVLMFRDKFWLSFALTIREIADRKQLVTFKMFLLDVESPANHDSGARKLQYPAASA